MKVALSPRPVRFRRAFEGENDFETSAPAQRPNDACNDFNLTLLQATNTVEPNTASILTGFPAGRLSS
jgi:hypothetical protein